MNGMINVYKEKGYTSHDVVAKLRGICHQKKIGHTGTLDPDAEGVLPVCLGTATKVCGLLTDKDKVYEAALLLGKETDTQDIGGTVLKEREAACTEAEIRDAISSFLGDYSQTPPMYSALKVNGQKLCDLARAGVDVERKPRPVHIYGIEVLWMELPRVKLRVHCSKGTYIRTLCHDIGQKLGCGGCMEGLLRTKVSIFELENARKLSEIQKLSEEGRLSEILLPPDLLFGSYPKAEVAEEFCKMLRNGNRLPRHALCVEQGEKGLLAQPNVGRLSQMHEAGAGITVGLAQPNASRLSQMHEAGAGLAGDGQLCLADGAGEDTGDTQMLRVYLDGLFYAIYMLDGERGDYKPVKIFGQGNGQ